MGSRITSEHDRDGQESSCDDRLVAAIEEYRAAVEAGRPIDRQAFLDQHSDIAKQLADCLAGMDIVQGPWLQGGSSLSRGPSGKAVKPDF